MDGEVKNRNARITQDVKRDNTDEHRQTHKVGQTRDGQHEMDNTRWTDAGDGQHETDRRRRRTTRDGQHKTDTRDGQHETDNTRRTQGGGEAKRRD